MKYIMAAAIACGALFFAVPIVACGSTDVCQAVALHDVQDNATPAEMSTSSTMYNVMDQASTVGSVGRQTHDEEERRHPHVPAVVSCAADFWKSL